MYKVYGRPNAGSLAVEAVLAELERPYELIRVDRNPDRTTPAWFKEINPRGEVPTLVLPDGSLMMESAAITIYLADGDPSGALAPKPDDPLRTRYLQWILFFTTAVYSAEIRWLYPEKVTAAVEHHKSVVAMAATERDAAHAIFAKALGQGPYILGERFSAADIYAAMILGWAQNYKTLFAQHSSVGALYARVANRPKLKPIFKWNLMPEA